MAKKGNLKKSTSSKSISRSKSKTVKLVKSKVASKSSSNAAKKKVLAKSAKSKSRAKSNAQDPFTLPTTAELPSVGDLPELPDFDGFSQSQAQSDVVATETASAAAQTNAQQSAEQKPKLWWLSWLLPGKKQPVIDVLESVDVTALEAADKMTPEESEQLAQMPTQEEMAEVLSSDSKAIAPVSSSRSKKSKKKQALSGKVPPQSDAQDHVARAYDEVETLKTRLDDEMRERQSVVDESHERVKLKEAELEKWHADLLSREKDVVKKEKEYERIKKLEAQVEDKEITLKYKEDEIEDLKNKLAEKELELTQQEAQLKEMADRFEKEKVSKQMQSSQVAHVSDDYAKLAKKHGHVVHRKVEPKAVLSKTISSVDAPSKREIRNLLLKAYDQLATSDMAGLQFTYNKVRDSYAKMIATTGPDEQLYKDILDLYNDIKLAVMQRN